MRAARLWRSWIDMNALRTGIIALLLTAGSVLSAVGAASEEVERTDAIQTAGPPVGGVLILNQPGGPRAVGLAGWSCPYFNVVGTVYTARCSPPPVVESGNLVYYDECERVTADGYASAVGFGIMRVTARCTGGFTADTGFFQIPGAQAAWVDPAGGYADYHPQYYLECQANVQGVNAAFWAHCTTKKGVFGGGD